MRMRFPLVWVSGACLGAAIMAAPAAHAQAAAGATAISARVDDIQVARDGETVSILIKLSQQPAAATARTSDEALTVEIDGVSLTPLTLTPPGGSLVRKVEAGSGKLTLSGAAFSNATTVIYRNAVLIEVKLAEPSLRTGASLMGVATPVKSAPAAIALAPVIPAPAPIVVKQAEPANDLQSHPAPPKPRSATTITAIAGIDGARCGAASAELANDAWALAAMGDYALCLLDADKLDEAKSRIDQLAAITPQDWRVALGRAVLAEKTGDLEKAQAHYVSASLAAPNDKVRGEIVSRTPATAKTPIDDLQLPLPKTVASSAH